MGVPSPWNSCLLHYQHSDVLLTALFFILSVFFDPLGSLWGSQGGGFSKEEAPVSDSLLLKQIKWNISQETDLTVFHLRWNWEYCFILCSHKYFDTCLIEMLQLLFCRDFSNGNHQRQSWFKAGMFFLCFGNYFVQKGPDFLAFRKWRHKQWERSRWQNEEFSCFVTVITWLDFYSLE